MSHFRIDVGLAQETLGPKGDNLTKAFLTFFF
jgi:hypothetical protein